MARTKRISKRQNDIFLRHWNAFLNDWEDVELADDEVQSLADLRLQLRMSRVVKKFFVECWEREVSITSQLVNSMFDHKTEAAKAAVRKAFKYYLGLLEIE